MIFSVSAFGSERVEKIRVLMETTGLVQTYEQQIAYGRERCKAQAQQMLHQVLEGLNPSPEFSERLRSAAEKFIGDLMPPWSASEIVEVWAGIYGEKFTDVELDGLISFYSSPLGKKDLQAKRDSLPEFQKHFEGLQKPLLEKATAEYIKNLQAIVAECNCEKEKTFVEPAPLQSKKLSKRARSR